MNTEIKDPRLNDQFCLNSLVCITNITLHGQTDGVPT